MQAQQIKFTNKNIFTKIKIFLHLKNTMMDIRFHENIEIINQKGQQFEAFLNQVKSKHFSPPDSLNNYQQKFTKQKKSQMNLNNEFDNQFRSNPQDLYDYKSQIKKKNINEQKFPQEIYSQSNFEIRRPQKLNPFKNKFFQEQNIKNQHQGQIIVLKSGNQLPPWLFQHIRKQNVNKLKNMYIKQDQIRKSQIIDQGEYQNKNKFTKAKQNLGQRYLNRSHGIKNNNNSVPKPNLQSQQHHFNYPREKAFKSNRKSYQYKKVSSSFQLPNFNKTTQHLQNLHRKRQSQGNNQSFVKDYDYSYCIENQQQQNRRKFKSPNYRSDNFSQNAYKDNLSGYKQKSNQYRIRQQDKLKYIKSAIKNLKQRIPTISEQQPLIEPRKFNIC